MLIATKEQLEKATTASARDLVVIAAFLSQKKARKIIMEVWNKSVFCVRDCWEPTRLDYRTAQTIIRKMRAAKLILDAEPPEGKVDARYTYMQLNKDMLSPVILAANHIAKRNNK